MNRILLRQTILRDDLRQPHTTAAHERLGRCVAKMPFDETLAWHAVSIQENRIGTPHLSDPKVSRSGDATSVVRLPRMDEAVAEEGRVSSTVFLVEMPDPSSTTITSKSVRV